MPDEEFQLTANDRASGLWRRLRAHFEDRVARLRIRNDNGTLSDHETAAIRGEIKALKALIALGDDRSVITE